MGALPFAIIALSVTAWLRWELSPLVVFPVGAALSLLCYGGYFALSFWAYIARTDRVGGSPTAHPADVRALVDRLSAKLSPQAAEFYFQMIIDPPRHTVRITDRISPTTRAYEFTRSMKIGVPADLVGEVVPLPLDLFSKGNLVNRLHVQGPSGQTVSTLSQDATIAHSTLVARLMVARIRGGHYLLQYQTDLEADILSFLCRNDAVSAGALEDIANRLVGLAARQRDRQRLLIVVTYLQMLATHYPLVVYCGADEATAGEELNAEHYLRMTITRRTIPVLGRHLGWPERQRERVRALFGIRPARVTWGLSPAMKARSYHLECMGPEGSYLGRQVIYAPTDAATSLLARLNHRMLPRHGQRFSHLYIHDFRPLSPVISAGAGSDLSYVASFYERPPGTTAASAVSAFTAAVLITVAAATRLRVSGTDLPAPSTDILAILLALPIVASAWLGFGNSPSIFLGALGARIALVSTMVCSLAAAALYLTMPAAGTASPWWERRTANEWIVLAVVIWFTFAAAGLSWLLRVWTYRHFIERAGDQSVS